MSDYRGGWVYGPCPGCDNWQIECPIDEDLSAVEAILAQHAAECPWLDTLATVAG